MKYAKTLSLVLLAAAAPTLAQDGTRTPDKTPDISTLLEQNGRNAWLNRSFRQVGANVAQHVLKIESERGTHLGYGVAIKGGFVLTANGILPRTQTTLRAVGHASTYSAGIAARNPVNDLALLKLGGAPAPAAIALGSSDKLRVGQFVGTIGRAGQVLAVGVISAKNRAVEPAKNQGNILMGLFSDGNNGPTRTYPKVLQHDGPLQTEHFGAPLIDAQGRLVGINVAAPYRGSSHAVGIGQISAVLPRLRAKADGAPEPAKPAPQVERPETGPRPFLGVKAAEETENLPPRYSCGIEVRELTPNSPAQKYGLQQGDMILEVDGQKFASIDAFADLVGKHRPGEQVEFSVLRGGAVLVKVKVTLGRR